MSAIIANVYKTVRKKYWFNKIRSIIDTKARRENVANLYYWRHGNFGDELNVDLMRYFGVRHAHSKPLGADLICIGSNLQQFTNVFSRHISKTRTLNVLGSGFIEESSSTPEHFMFDVNFYAVRGRLSRDRCEKAVGHSLPSVALGDPGLLISRFFPDIRCSEEYDVGVIVHMGDKDSAYLDNIRLKDKSVVFIDIQQPTKHFVRQVAQCKFILSSAMHGLICADSLRIPNKHIVLGGDIRGGEYKFKDYYSVFSGFNYSPVYLESHCVTDSDINTYSNEYTITSNEIESICDRLESKFRLYKKDKVNVKSR